MTEAEKMAREWIDNCIEEKLDIKDAVFILVAGIQEVAERTREECARAGYKHANGSKIVNINSVVQKIRNVRWEDEINKASGEGKKARAVLAEVRG